MNNSIQIYQPTGTSLVEIRMDSERFPRLKNLNSQSATTRLQQVVAMAYVYTGRPAEETKIQMVAAALYSELIEDKKGLGTGNITIEEIGHAIKSEILSQDDMYVSIATLYKAVCKYAEGEGHEAQQEAYNRKVAERKKLLDKSPVGVMLKAYESKTLKSTKL